MAGHGGARPGAGRPRGSVNIRSSEIIKKIEESGMTPLDFLVSVYQDPQASRTERLQAARAAAPFCHARLSNVEMDVTSPGDQDPESMTDEELLRIIKGVDEAA